MEQVVKVKTVAKYSLLRGAVVTTLFSRLKIFFTLLKYFFVLKTFKYNLEIPEIKIGHSEFTAFYHQDEEERMKLFGKMRFNWFKTHPHYQSFRLALLFQSILTEVQLYMYDVEETDENPVTVKSNYFVGFIRREDDPDFSELICVTKDSSHELVDSMPKEEFETLEKNSVSFGLSLNPFDLFLLLYTHYENYTDEETHIEFTFKLTK